jgi:hypothetical protein
MNKKFIAGVLTLSMLVGLSAPVMAETGELVFDKDHVAFEVSGNSIVTEPKVKLTLGVDEEFSMNPFKLSAELGEDSVSGQVIGKVHEVENIGDVAVDVAVTSLVANPVGNNGKYDSDKKGFPITISPSPVKAGDWKKTKTIQLYLQFESEKANLEKDGKVVAKAIQAMGKDNKPVDAEKKGGKNLKAIQNLKKGDTYYYQLKGSMNENPKKFGTKDEHDAWNKDDVVNISYKIIITPKKN